MDRDYKVVVLGQGETEVRASSGSRAMLEGFKKLGLHGKYPIDFLRMVTSVKLIDPQPAGKPPKYSLEEKIKFLEMAKEAKEAK